MIHPPIDEDSVRELIESNPDLYRDWRDPNNRVFRQKAIRLKCLDCCVGSAPEVRRCDIVTCSLWPYRMGYESRQIYP